jgi:DHA1 family bicyclomycin/chloramphenicol resistance-like MFS transporter
LRRLLTTPPFGRASGESFKAPFLLLVALTACGTMGMHVIIPALPATARALHMSISTTQLTITLYLVGLAFGQLFYGPVSDRFGRRPVLLIGLTLFTLASIVTACAPDASVLIGSRILQSIGGCAGLVLGRAAVRDAATPDKAAGQLAMLTLVMSVVPALAPAVGGYLTAYIHWRASYVLLAAMGGLTLLVSLLILPETNRQRTGGTSAGSLLTGYALLLRSPAFLGFAVGGACSTTSFYAFMSASPFIFENVLHRPTQEVGLYYVLLMGGVGSGSFLANRLSRIVGLRRGLRLANVLTIAGAALFGLFDLLDLLSAPAVTGAVTLFMVGAGMASPFALAGSVSVNPRTIGAASGLYGFFQMGYGMLCTVAVEVWHPGAVWPVVLIMLLSVLAGQVIIALGTRPA